LGLLVIAAFGVLGIAVGSAIKEGTLMGIALSFPVLVVGWLSLLIGVLLWRGCCEFFLAVMSIAEDLRYLRQHQERLEPQSEAAVTSPSTVTPEVGLGMTPGQASEFGKAEGEQQAVASGESNILEDPFFRPRFEKK